MTMRNSSLDFESLRYLSAPAPAGNFGRAAKALGVQTSTVSRKIARVEDELGVTVFERGHFGIRLTPAGKAMMVHAHRILADVEELRRSSNCTGLGHVGNIQLGIRMPPVARRCGRY
jgi:DNA-binding transcriptional LysR family regulator